MGVKEQTRLLDPADWSWPFWPAFPLYPYGRRRTLRQEVVQDWIWTFEQIQGILYVVTPIRMTVVRLESGGLLVYAPIAPTSECVQLLQDLVLKYGEVKFIVLPTVSGLEHKVFVGPFARRFPRAQVFIAPNQWSFPVNLPLGWLGFPTQRTQILPVDSGTAPFAQDFDYAILGSLDLGLGQFGEAAFFHRRSRTVLLTDLLIAVPEQPPAVVQLDPYPLLFHARESAGEAVEDTITHRLKGWQRIVLFSLYFRPSALKVLPLRQTLQAASASCDRSRRAYFGLYPFQWQPNWRDSFAALHGGGRPFVAPILQTLILNRAPQATLTWVHQVASWNFERIIPCHFERSLTITPQTFLYAFQFLEPSAHLATGRTDLPEVDFTLLKSLDAALIRYGITLPPSKASPKEP